MDRHIGVALMGQRSLHEDKGFRIGCGARRFDYDKRECGNEARCDGLLPALQVIERKGADGESASFPFAAARSPLQPAMG